LGENYHLLPIVTITSSGIDNKLWIGRLLEEYAKANIISGPLFRNKLGSKITAIDFEPQFFDHLEQIQASRPDLIPSSEDITEEYGIYRSFRRVSTSEAMNKRLSPDVIDANNRWRRFLRAGTSKPLLTMRDHYTGIRLTLNQSLRFSSIL
jgi:hypothetical protein